MSAILLISIIVGNQKIPFDVKSSGVMSLPSFVKTGVLVQKVKEGSETYRQNRWYFHKYNLFPWKRKGSSKINENKQSLILLYPQYETPFDNSIKYYFSCSVSFLHMFLLLDFHYLPAFVNSFFLSWTNFSWQNTIMHLLMA